MGRIIEPMSGKWILYDPIDMSYSFHETKEEAIEAAEEFCEPHEEISEEVVSGGAWIAKLTSVHRSKYTETAFKEDTCPVENGESDECLKCSDYPRRCWETWPYDNSFDSVGIVSFVKETEVLSGKKR